MHYALVRSMAAEGRILEFKLSDGWKPLCKFLGKKVPNVPFPHMNDKKANSQSFKELAVIMLKRMAWKSAQIGALIAVPVAASVWWWRSSA